MDIHSTRTDLPVLLLYNVDQEWTPEEVNEAHLATRVLCDALRAEGHPVTEVCLDNPDLSPRLTSFYPDDYLVFNWCEELPGIPRSSAMVAQTLETLGFVFTGADSQALALSQDKPMVKQRLDESGISTPVWQIFTSACSNGWNRFPAIVKPAFEHCSYGVSRNAVVCSLEELAVRIAFVLDTFNQPALVEEFINGREFHVTVVGNGVLQALPPAEMDFSAFEDIKDRLCTYESKFDPQSVPYNSIKLRLPASLSVTEELELNKIVLDAYRATDCRDYARLDLRLRDGIFYTLDVNPNADISPDTSLAAAAEMTGLPYGKFASLLVNLASQRHSIFCKSATSKVSHR
jgi:D-alanine-D-alanine ligase